jgi:hypothetical protein
MQLSWGARPPRAQWAAPSRATRRHMQTRSLIGVLVHSGVRREGAPNSSRGGCAPHPFQLHRSGSVCLEPEVLLRAAERIGARTRRAGNVGEGASSSKFVVHIFLSFCFVLISSSALFPSLLCSRKLPSGLEEMLGEGQQTQRRLHLNRRSQRTEKGLRTTAQAWRDRRCPGWHIAAASPSSHGPFRSVASCSGLHRVTDWAMLLASSSNSSFVTPLPFRARFVV